MNEPFPIFLSHASAYTELAETLGRSLEALEADQQLDVRICTKMQGGTKWREWIEENARSARMFLLLYPDEHMNMNWCNYELGRFYDGKGYIITLKNVDIEKPPPVFEPYQAYNGSEQGILKFLQELFASETFTPGIQLNPAIGEIGSRDYERATAVARQLAAAFAKERIKEKFYERRILVKLRHADGGLDPQKTLVEGNPEGLAVLGLGSGAQVTWSEMRSPLPPDFDWPSAVEQSVAGIAHGQLPPSLPPFRVGPNIYLPVITRSETIDNMLHRLAIIFVRLDSDGINALVDWATPAAMPSPFAGLVRLVRMMLRARWEILEPRLTEVKFGIPADEQCKDAAAWIIAAYAQIAHDARQQGFVGIDQFMNLFHAKLRPKVKEVGDAYLAAMEALRTSPDEGCAPVVEAIERLRQNNARWLQLAAAQFAYEVEDLLPESQAADAD